MTITKELYDLVKGTVAYIFNKGYILTPSSVKTVNTTIVSADLTGVLLVVSNTGNVNCTSIDLGINGQTMEIWGTSDANTVSLTSSTSNVMLNDGISFTLGLGDVIVLRYMTVNSINKWCEISRSNNT